MLARRAEEGGLDVLRINEGEGLDQRAGKLAALEELAFWNQYRTLKHGMIDERTLRPLDDVELRHIRVKVPPQLEMYGQRAVIYRHDTLTHMGVALSAQCLHLKLPHPADADFEEAERIVDGLSATMPPGARADYFHIPYTGPELPKLTSPSANSFVVLGLLRFTSLERFTRMHLARSLIVRYADYLINNSFQVPTIAGEIRLDKHHEHIFDAFFAVHAAFQLTRDKKYLQVLNELAQTSSFRPSTRRRGEIEMGGLRSVNLRQWPRIILMLADIAETTSKRTRRWFDIMQSWMRASMQSFDRQLPLPGSGIWDPASRRFEQFKTIEEIQAHCAYPSGQATMGWIACLAQFSTTFPTIRQDMQERLYRRLAEPKWGWWNAIIGKDPTELPPPFKHMPISVSGPAVAFWLHAYNQSKLHQLL
jgi:hypothetical protein